jgi:hypothetical protein
MSRRTLSTRARTWIRLGACAGAAAVCGCSASAGSKDESLGTTAEALHTPPGEAPCTSTPMDPIAFCRSLPGYNVIIGTSNNDIINGTAGNDCIVGLGGQDVINGLGGDDVIFGGDGDDRLAGGDGNDQIFGGSGQDQISGGAGNDRLFGEDGDDTIHGGDGNDELVGGQGQDHLFGENDNDTIAGGDGDDVMQGGAGNNDLDDCIGHNSFNGGTGVSVCAGDPLSSSFTACTSLESCRAVATPDGGTGDHSTLLATSEDGARELAITDTQIFFTGFLTLQQVGRTGGSVTTVFDAFATEDGQIGEGIDVDSTAVYFVVTNNGNFVPQQILRQPMIGGAPITLVSQSPDVLLPQFPQVTGGLVYNVTISALGTVVDFIQETPVGGPLNNTTNLFSATHMFPPVDLVRPYLVSCGDIFFERLQPQGGTSIQVMPAAGGTPSTLVGAASAPGDIVFAFDSDGQFLYYATREQVVRVPVGGGTVQVLASEPGRVITKLVVDAQNVYALATLFGPFGQCLDMQVIAVPKGGGTATVLEDLTAKCGTDIAQDEATLFFTDSEVDDGIGPSEVRRLPK